MSMNDKPSITCPIQYLDSISARVKDKPGLMVRVDLSEIEYLKILIRLEREVVLNNAVTARLKKEAEMRETRCL